MYFRIVSFEAMIVYKRLLFVVSTKNTWLHLTECKLFVLDHNTWNHIAVGKQIIHGT